MFQSIKPQNIRGTVGILLAIFIIFILSGCASTNSQYQLDLLELETRLGLGEFPKTTSILVSQKGKLVYEQYFGKGRPGKGQDRPAEHPRHAGGRGHLRASPGDQPGPADSRQHRRRADEARQGPSGGLRRGGRG